MVSYGRRSSGLRDLQLRFVPRVAQRTRRSITFLYPLLKIFFFILHFFFFADLIASYRIFGLAQKTTSRTENARKTLGDDVDDDYNDADDDYNELTVILMALIIMTLMLIITAGL